MTIYRLSGLRIGIICYPTYGGSGAVATELAEALGARGHEVHVISYATPFRLFTEANVTFHEVEVPSYPLFKYPPYATALSSRLAEEIRNFDIQVLHAHYAIPHSLAAYMAREMVDDRPVAVVTTLHGTDITLVGSDPSYRPATKFALKKSDRVTAVSRFLKEETKRLICDKSSMEVIHNFVDTSRYAPGVEQDLRGRYADPGEPLLMHMSNFRPVKRIADVVRIFKGVNDQIPSRLLMVGDGPDRRMAERMLREMELHHRATFTGSVPDAATLIAQTDAFLLPSDGESFGLAALEAASCAVPVVGARAGGLPEVIEDGVHGILEAVGDTKTMAQRLAALLLDPERKRAMGTAAREMVLARFQTHQIVPLYEAVYAGAIADAHRRFERLKALSQPTSSGDQDC